MELKRVKVRRLESDNPSHIHKLLEGDLLYHDKSTKRFNFTWTQHLYFTIDEEPKGGEWCYHVASHTITKYPKGGFPKGHAFKIIGTTDPKLKLDGYGEKDGHWYIASPTQAFVKKYCKVGGIDEVLVEFEKAFSKTICSNCNNTGYLESEDFMKPRCSYCNRDGKQVKEELQLKISSHNTITIHPFKNSWDREEVEELCRNALHTRFSGNICMQEDADKWIENHLKKY